MSKGQSSDFSSILSSAADFYSGLGKRLLQPVTVLPARALYAWKSRGQEDAIARVYKARDLIDLSSLHRERAVKGLTRAWLHGSGLPVLPEPEIATKLEERSRDVFLTYVTKAFDGLPPAIRYLMAEGGIRTRLARRAIDVDPIMAAMPSVTGNGSNESNWLAYYSSRFKQTTMLQQVKIHGKTNSYMDIDSKSLTAAFNHESGHGIDDVLDDFSQTAIFTAAYEEDLANLSYAERKSIEGVDCYVLKKRTSRSYVEKKGMPVDSVRYFLDVFSGGMHPERGMALKEAFAEIFACVVEKRDIGLHLLFPHTADVMKKLLRSIEFEMQTPYDPQKFLNIKTPALGT